MRQLVLPHHQRESGTVLILFALLLIGILAILGLTIDTGFVLLSRRQMQAAVNTASIEGLRWRDQLPPDGDLIGLGLDPDDPLLQTETDLIRRRMSRHFVLGIFDDDGAIFDEDYSLGTPNADSTVLGTGVAVSDEGGTEIAGGFRAFATINESNTYVYTPQLALNLLNQDSGDMVSGQYQYGLGHLETPEYLRNDFSTAPNLFDPTLPENAFLVRLRRSDEVYDEVDDPSLSTHSSGPTIPSLFSRGAILRAEGDDPHAILTRRERGTQVRATAIADLQPAISVGFPVFERDTLGNPLSLLRTGAVYFIAESRLSALTVADDLNEIIPIPLYQGSIVLGDVVSPTLGAIVLPDGNLQLVAAIYDSTATPRTVIGFAHIQVTVVAGSPTAVQLAGDLILNNGSSTFLRTNQLDASTFPILKDQFWTFYQNLQPLGAVSVPAKVRTIR